MPRTNSMAPWAPKYFSAKHLPLCSYPSWPMSWRSYDLQPLPVCLSMPSLSRDSFPMKTGASCCVDFPGLLRAAHIPAVFSTTMSTLTPCFLFRTAGRMSWQELSHWALTGWVLTWPHFLEWNAVLWRCKGTR